MDRQEGFYMKSGFRDWAKRPLKSIRSMMNLIVPAAVILSLSCATQGRAQANEGDASNRAFDLLIKRFAPPGPTFILTPERYALWMPNPKDAILISAGGEINRATENESLSSATLGETGDSREEDGPLWGQQDLDDTSFGTNALQSNDTTINDDLSNASTPTVETEDMQNQLQALVLIEPEADESAVGTESSSSSTSASDTNDFTQDTQVEIEATNLTDVAPSELTPASLTANASVEPSSGSSVADPAEAPPTPASRPKETIEPARAPSSASTETSESLEVLTGSEAQILYDQLISTGTTRGSNVGSFSTMPSQISPVPLSPAQQYTLEELNAMTPAERWDAMMGRSSQ